MKILLTLFVLGLLAACVLMLHASRGVKKDRTGSYRRRKLMTENELEFFGRLVVALPDHYIFPQVAMSALLEPASGDKAKAHGDRLRIAQQRVDYVVATRGGEVVAVVELDDRTHVRAKDQLRDARLAQGAIRTVRFESRHKPRVDAIRAAVLGAPAPAPALAPATAPRTATPAAVPAPAAD
jgi:hypothetical protein